MSRLGNIYIGVALLGAAISAGEFIYSASYSGGKIGEFEVVANGKPQPSDVFKVKQEDLPVKISFIINGWIKSPRLGSELNAEISNSQANAVDFKNVEVVTRPAKRNGDRVSLGKNKLFDGELHSLFLNAANVLFNKNSTPGDWVVSYKELHVNNYRTENVTAYVYKKAREQNSRTIWFGIILFLAGSLFTGRELFNPNRN